nr:TPA_asm: integrase [Megastigmus wasp adintovirus]
MNQRKDLVEELHKPARRNYLRRSFDIRDLDETWQADLVEMIPYSQQNKGFKYLLTVIDIQSKFAWAVPVKQKTGKDVAKAMESIFKNGRVPINLQTDRGKEFYNKDFDNLMQRHKIHLYSTYSNLKASICERFNRTLKNKMWKLFSLNGNYKWLNILPDLIAQYNKSYHRSIGMKPVDVTVDKVPRILDRLSASKVQRPLFKRAKFKVNDKVRVSKNKQIFEKGYTPNWSTEIFSIDRVNRTVPYTYHLKDYQNQPITGGFYEEELLKTKCPDIYLVEKIIKKRGNNYYVKWLGFDNSHNSWISKDDM